MTSGPGDLDCHARGAIEALERLGRAAWDEADRSDHLELVELLGTVCAAQHGLPPLVPPDSGAPGRPGDLRDDGWRARSDLTGADRALLAFAEQFAVDVSAITDRQRSALLEQWGGRAPSMVAVTFALDFVPRARAALSALDGAPVPGAGTSESGGLRIWDALDGLIRTVPRLDALDPVTSELIRLRGARQHRCRLCQSLRSRPAVLSGADESFLVALDDYERSDLSPHRKAALAMTDAMIWTPGQVGSAARRLRMHASLEQCVEVVADVTRNAVNKIAVSLAADAPHVEEGIEFYDLDPDGEILYGLTLD